MRKFETTCSFIPRVVCQIRKGSLKVQKIVLFELFYSRIILSRMSIRSLFWKMVGSLILNHIFS